MTTSATRCLFGKTTGTNIENKRGILRRHSW
jgi:hypothetical protein